MPQITKTKHRGHALRKGRVSITNQIYSITTVTRDRQRYFADFNAARTLIRVLQIHEQQGDAKTLCFVVMPDHLHWLMQLQHRKNLSATVRSIKSTVSRTLGVPVWQKGFHDRAVRHEEDLSNIARYIVANPVRAGLVKSIREYPHWVGMRFGCYRKYSAINDCLRHRIKADRQQTGSYPSISHRG